MSEEYRLPPGVPSGGPDIGHDPAAAEARGRALLEQAAAGIVEGVEREAAGWVVRAVTRVLDAWGRLDDTTRRRALDDAPVAGARARDRVVAELRALFAEDAADQRATPLEIVRGLRHEPTALLAALGIPEVARDPFAARAFPDDRYDLTITTLGDLGDPDLAPLLLAWGLGKATVLRARAARAE
ncbi:MAG TPA: hypothetical protein VFZ83_00785 [Acidimicrobiia bacterium]|nr:hypothetical protein [Acidimicrobiia bacterium]